MAGAFAGIVEGHGDADGLACVEVGIVEAGEPAEGDGAGVVDAGCVARYGEGEDWEDMGRAGVIILVKEVGKEG